MTEAGLIGTSEYVPLNVWMVMFLEAQGYDIKKNTIFQDNQRTIRMEKNGRDYCTVYSKDINIHLFFVKYIVDKGEIYFKHCPTHLIISEYFTKSL